MSNRHRFRQLFWLVALFAVALTAAAILHSCGERSAYRLPQAERERINDYQITVRFYPEQRLLIGTETVKINSLRAIPAQELLFHLYPNAFRNISTLPITNDQTEKAGLNQWLSGGISVTAVNINQKATAFLQSETLLTIPLNHWQALGRGFQVTISWQLTLPTGQMRLGIAQDVALFSNWYPVLAVNQNGVWRADPYLPVGDPFLSEVANYQVTLSVPNGYQVAATGIEVSRSTEAMELIVIYQANNMRDFAFVASPRLQLRSVRSNDVLIQTAWYSDKQWADVALDVAERAVDTYSRLFGRYPYQSLTVAETALGLFGGMEYPSLVILGPYGQRDSSIAEAARIEQEVAHEVAHQWWYGAVGSDQILAPWQDESLATYSTILYLADRYGPAQLAEYRLAMPTPSANRISDSLYDFTDWTSYFATAYVKGGHLLDDLRQRVGDVVFLQLLQAYYQRWQGHLASPADFLVLLKEQVGVVAADWFAKELATR